MSTPVKILNILLDKAKAFGVEALDLSHATFLLNNGEYSLCLDALATQVYESSTPIDAEFYTLISIASGKMYLPLENYACLKELIRR